MRLDDDAALLALTLRDASLQNEVYRPGAYWSRKTRNTTNQFDGIVAWATSRQTNGFLAAINSLFQAAKRKARGYGRFRAIRSVIFLIAGKLDFSKLNPYGHNSTADPIARPRRILCISEPPATT